jgi:hypothetical protein
MLTECLTHVELKPLIFSGPTHGHDNLLWLRGNVPTAGTSKAFMASRHSLSIGLPGISFNAEWQVLSRQVSQALQYGKTEI